MVPGSISLPHSATARVPQELPQQITCPPQALVGWCDWITHTLGWAFAGLIVEQQARAWSLRYPFYSCLQGAGPSQGAWTHLVVQQPLEQLRYPSISAHVHAADWQEREAEDLFGLTFEGHPRLGDFVLHDDLWQEGLAPMRHEFDARTRPPPQSPAPDWKPERIVREPGVFAMPIGPVYGGITEPAHFLLETVGEEVIRVLPRFFYKYRAIEKIAEGTRPEDLLLLAERFNGTAALAHGLACAQALEAISGTEAPARARMLRVLLAELERLRHHAGAIQEVCESTALVVAASQAAMREEELLRLCGALTGHRYLFGLVSVGGLSCDLPDAALKRAVNQARGIVARLERLEEQLTRSSSFLDRLEEVGIVTAQQAQTYGLVGPIARASGLARDLRRVQPYASYADCSFEVPREQEGDGYARLRVLFAESRQSLRIIEDIFTRLPGGPVSSGRGVQRAGAALGWTEAPLGAAFHWVRVDEYGRVSRYRILPPSFVNWHALHLAAERFAFQDFPIILASFGLSVAENDR